MLLLFCLFQEFSEWKKGAADVRLPTANINRMDHLSSYVQVVTDATQELCDLILGSYREKLNLAWKSSVYHVVYFTLHRSGSSWRKYLQYFSSNFTDCHEV